MDAHDAYRVRPRLRIRRRNGGPALAQARQIAVPLQKPTALRCLEARRQLPQRTQVFRPPHAVRHGGVGLLQPGFPEHIVDQLRQRKALCPGAFLSQPLQEAFKLRVRRGYSAEAVVEIGCARRAPYRRQLVGRKLKHLACHGRRQRHVLMRIIQNLQDRAEHLDLCRIQNAPASVGHAWDGIPRQRGRIFRRSPPR